LQPQVAVRRKAERLTRKIANFHTGIIRGMTQSAHRRREYR
jgi:hypothetical protein